MFQLIVGALGIGGVYGLSALGLSLVYGVMRIVNVAHGSLLMLSAFITFWLFTLYGFDPLLAVFLNMLLMFIIGMFIQKLLISRLFTQMGRLALTQLMMMTLLMLFGVSLFIDNLALTLWGGTYRSVVPAYSTAAISFFGLLLPILRFSTFVISSLIAAIVFMYLNWTYMGKAIRAVSQHRELAAVLGIDVERVSLISYCIGVALAGCAGSLLSTIFTFNPMMGTEFVLKAFAIIVLGGMGSILGAIVGGLLLGIAEVFFSFFYLTSLADVISYIVLISVLLVRPSGIMGKIRE